MANAIYPKWKEAIIQASANSSLGGTVKIMLVDLADYGYSAVHDFLDDVPAGARVGTAPTLGTKTYVNGTFDFADPTWTAVTGDPSEAIITYIDTGVEATSRLVDFRDTGVTGLPVTPNGGDVTLVVHASGYWQI